MVLPIALASNTGRRPALVDYRNIIQKISASDITALELYSCRAAGGLKVVESEGAKARNRIEIFKDHDAVKDRAESVVRWGPRLHDVIKKAQIVEGARRCDKGLADRVKIGTSRSKECTERIVRRRHRPHAKEASDGRGRGGLSSKGTGFKVAINNQVGGSWSGGSEK